MEEQNNLNLPFKGTIVACIPAFNAEKSITSVVLKTREYVDQVIVVNDGSIDETAALAEKAGAKVINHPVNLGYGSAIKTCLKAGIEIKADIIITLDSDLQHNPAEIPALVQPIIGGESDLVTGSRFVIENKGNAIPTYRKFGITVLTKVTNFMAQTTISDATTGFRAYSSHAARVLASMGFSPGMGASSQILIEAFRSGLRIKEVHVKILYGTGVDTSTQNALSMGMGILASIIRYITIRRPLSLIGIPGLAVLCLGIAGLFMLLNIFNATRAIPSGLGMFTIATVVIGLVLLLSSFFLYTLSTVSKEILSRTREKSNIARDESLGSSKTSIIRYITIRRPLSLIGIPGLAVLCLGIAGLFMLLNIFNATRAIPSGLGMFTIATVVIGLVLLMTSVILYTVSRLLKL